MQSPCHLPSWLQCTQMPQGSAHLRKQARTDLSTCGVGVKAGTPEHTCKDCFTALNRGQPCFGQCHSHAVSVAYVQCICIGCAAALVRCSSKHMSYTMLCANLRSPRPACTCGMPTLEHICHCQTVVAPRVTPSQLTCTLTHDQRCC